MAKSRVLHVRITESTYQKILEYVKQRQKYDPNYSVSRFIRDVVVEKLMELFPDSDSSS